MSKLEMLTPQKPHDRLETFNNIQSLAKAAKDLMSFANGKVKVFVAESDEE
jgi:hypothetical protein